jgi:MFS family permease
MVPMIGRFGTNGQFARISSFQILAMFRRTLFYSFMSIYLRHYLGLSVTETTLFATIPMIANAGFQTFIWGAVSDKFQLRRTLIVVGEVAAALITVLVWYLHTLPDSHSGAGYVIIWGMTVVEVFWSMSNVGWTALLSDLYPAQERAGLQGRLTSVGAVGGVIGLWAGGIAYDGLGHHFEGWGFEGGLLFFAAAGVMLVSTIPILGLPEGGIDPAASKGNGGEIAAADPAKKSVSRVYLLFLAAMVCINFGLNSVALLKSQYLTLETGFDASSRMLSFVFNMSAAAMFSIGLLIRSISARVRDELLLLTGTAVAIVYLLGYAFAPSLPFIFASDFMGGAAQVIVMSSSYAFASTLIPPELRARQFAWFNATFFLSWGVPGTLITGPLVDRLIASGASETAAYQAAFMAGSVLVFVGAILLFLDIRLLRRAVR